MPEAPLPAGLDGTCDRRFAAIADIVANQLEGGSHNGVAVAIRHRGKPAVDLWGGSFEQDSMAISFSTTKGVAATALHMAIERHRVDYDTPIADLWPEFAKNGKESITIRHALCHEAGIPQIRDEVAQMSDLANWDLMIEMVERLVPLWEPGTANGYHAVNFGWIVGELLRRIDGRAIAQFLAEEISGPLGLDGLFIGTPEKEHHRVVPLIGEELSPASQELIPADHLFWRALSVEGDMKSFLNSPLGWSTCGPAFTGMFTARSLAKMYSVLQVGGELDGVRLLTPETIATMTKVQNKRPDLVLFLPMYWRLGYMGGGSQMSPAGPNREAFGHSGLGGSLAFADPKAEIAMAVTLDKLELEFLGGERVRTVVNAAIAAAESG